MSALPQTRPPKKADYLLEYNRKKLAVIEAKNDELPVEKGIFKSPEEYNEAVKDLENELYKIG
jgi:type I site-specific restriction endonuclease